MCRNKQDGFTLIELLVVIAIIGLLSAIVFAGLNETRAKGENAKILKMVKEYRTALELYYDDNNSYPITSTAGYCLGNYSNNLCGANNGISENLDLNTNLNNYIKNNPVVSNKEIAISSTDFFKGATYKSINGTTYQIIYMLSGDTDCGFGFNKYLFDNTYCYNNL